MLCVFCCFLTAYIIRYQFILCYTSSLFLCCLGDADAAASFARQLLALGADPNLRSRWTNMRALHYAAYFDVPQLIQVVLQASQPGGEKMPFAKVVRFWWWWRRRSFCTGTVQFSCSSNSKWIRLVLECLFVWSDYTLGIIHRRYTCNTYQGKTTLSNFGRWVYVVLMSAYLFATRSWKSCRCHV